MYTPSHFAETRTEVLHEALRAARLFTLVTRDGDGLDASHLPMLLDAPEGRPARLVGHLARPNPQWKTAVEGAPALAIAVGPDAYVSPTWYPSKREAGRAVPTWNYVALHVHGPVRFFHDRDRLLEVVERLTERHEGGRAHPWRVSDAPPDFLEVMLKGIVGVELEITRIEGKWKASQNRSEPDRRGVVEGLRANGEAAMAGVVEVRLRGGG
jgi:transcriptional regulator